MDYGKSKYFPLETMTLNQVSCIQGYILRLPANFYGEIFAEEEAKKADAVLKWKVTLKKYKNKTKTYAPRYSFKDTDNFCVCREWLPPARLRHFQQF